MDVKYLAEIKAREQAATPGPWNRIEHKHGRLYVGTNEKPIADICNLYHTESEANLAFISHSRTDIPELIAEVERMTAEIATLKKALELACEEITKHTCECPASLYGAEMCENCNDDDCDSNRTDRWCDYFIQAQKQEGHDD